MTLQKYWCTEQTAWRMGIPHTDVSFPLLRVEVDIELPLKLSICLPPVRDRSEINEDNWNYDTNKPHPEPQLGSLVLPVRVVVDGWVDWFRCPGGRAHVESIGLVDDLYVSATSDPREEPEKHVTVVPWRVNARIIAAELSDANKQRHASYTPVLHEALIKEAHRKTPKPVRTERIG